MKKIIVTIPIQKGGKWTVSAFGSRGKQRKNAWSAFKYVEKQIFAKENLNFEGSLKEKTSVLVKNGSNPINESLSSSQPRYLMFCLTAFLEDYLSEYVFSNKEKKYGENKKA